MFLECIAVKFRLLDSHSSGTLYPVNAEDIDERMGERQVAHPQDSRGNPGENI